MRIQRMAQGFPAGRDRIVRLRRELALRGKQKRKFKATSNSNHDLSVAENLLKQTFAPTRPNEARVTDINYVTTGEGWLYLAGIKDVFTCELVDYAMDVRMTHRLLETKVSAIEVHLIRVPAFRTTQDRSSADAQATAHAKTDS